MVADDSGLKTQIALIAKDVSYIKKAIDGNGEPGLVHETRTNTDYRIMCETKNKLVQLSIGSGWFLVLLMILLQVAGVI